MSKPSKVHYSVHKNRPVCGMPAKHVSSFRTDVTCKSCKHLMRLNLGGVARKVKHTLVVIGSIGKKTVYIDVPARKAIERYIETNGDNPSTRHHVEAMEVFKTKDEFEVSDLWIKESTTPT